MLGFSIFMRKCVFSYYKHTNNFHNVSNMHTHICTYTHVHMCTYARVQMDMHICMRTYAHARAHAHAHAHMYDVRCTMLACSLAQ